MIFITLGSQKFQFNRLLKAVDDLIEHKKIQDEVFAQTGYSDYQNIISSNNFLTEMILKKWKKEQIY